MVSMAAVMVDERGRGGGGGSSRGGATWEDDPVVLARAWAQCSPWEADDLVATARARAQQALAPARTASSARARPPPHGRPGRHNRLRGGNNPKPPPPPTWEGDDLVATDCVRGTAWGIYKTTITSQTSD